MVMRSLTYPIMLVMILGLVIRVGRDGPGDGVRVRVGDGTG